MSVDAPNTNPTDDGTKTRKRRARVPIEPRLLSDEQAAVYIGASPSYVRAMIANRKLRRVELPAIDPKNGRARMLRLDVRDLDAFVDRMKG